ncbi:MAG: TonB-dependent receptor [Myxococcota bacterium]|jgi:outer membrane cobalamin receptor|nr:TonB-dependent receptor [Myxococcota bacterium]
MRQFSSLIFTCIASAVLMLTWPAAAVAQSEPRETDAAGGTGQAPNQQEHGGTGQAPNQQEHGGTGQAPNQQEHGGTGQAPNQQEIEELEAIIVEDEQLPEPLEPTASTLSVDGDTVKQSSRPSLLEVLSERASDVYVSARGLGLHGVASGASGGIKVRGLGGSPNSQVLIVEDGVPDVQGVFGHPLPDGYVPFLLASAEVVKGGDSVRYGSNAMGAVVLLKNRWPEAGQFELRTDSAWGSYDTLSQSVTLLAPLGPVQTRAAFSAWSSEGERDGAGGQRWVAQFGVRLPLEHWSIELHEKLFQVHGADPGPIDHPHTGHDFDVLRNNSSLRLSFDQARWSWSAQPYLSVGLHRLYDGFHSLDWSVGLRSELSWQALDGLEALFGLSAEHTEGDVQNVADGVSEPTDAQNDLGAFAQATLLLFERLHLMGGLRFHHSLRWGSYVLAKGGIRLELPAGFSLRARVARNFRQPTIRELYLPYPVANPELQPELALNSDVGIGWDYGVLHLESNVYRSYAKQLIKTFGAWPTATVVNIDEIEVWGIEASATLTALGPFNASSSFAWQDVGRFTKQNPSLKANTMLEAVFPIGLDTLRASLSFEWLSGLFQNNYSLDPMDDVYVLDGNLRYQTVLESWGVGLDVYLKLRNLLNREAAYIEGYPMPGFNLLLGLGLEL